MDILKPIVNGQRIDANQPICMPVVRRNEDGSFEGKLYLAIGGLPRGHIEFCATGLEELKAMANGFVGWLQQQAAAESRILKPVGALPKLQ
jgi:hypothetical protein